MQTVPIHPRILHLFATDAPIGFVLFSDFPAVLLLYNKRILSAKQKPDKSLKKNDLLSRAALAARQRRGLSWQN